ncbi:hypothetical protein CYMTET_29507, partial [Cymbomonas tetramitiformis]
TVGAVSTALARRCCAGGAESAATVSAACGVAGAAPPYGQRGESACACPDTMCVAGLKRSHTVGARSHTATSAAPVIAGRGMRNIHNRSKLETMMALPKLPSRFDESLFNICEVGFRFREVLKSMHSYLHGYSGLDKRTALEYCTAHARRPLQAAVHSAAAISPPPPSPPLESPPPAFGAVSTLSESFCYNMFDLPNNYPEMHHQFLPPDRWQGATAGVTNIPPKIPFNTHAVRACARLVHTQPQNGVGSTLHSYVKPLLYSWMRNWTLQTPDWNGLTDESCIGNGKSRTPECYVQPWGKCKSIPGLATVQLDRNESTWDTRYDILDQRWGFPMHWGLEAGSTVKKGSAKNMLWLAGQAIAHLTRVRPEIESETQQAWKDSGLSAAAKPILGVHVRQGDSCLPDEMMYTARECHELEAYMPAIRNMIERYGYRTVYLVSDTMEVYDQTKQNPLPNKANWLVRRPEVAIQQSRLMQKYKFENGRRQMKVSGLVSNWLVDVGMLAMTDGFVGKFTSNTDRFVLELMAGRSQSGACLKPYYSIDGTGYCFHYGQFGGRRLTKGGVERGQFVC